MSGVAWWSHTAATNAGADPSIGWAEGMAPSSVNDSARAEMASVAKWRDDIAGATVTSGTSTAFTLTTYQSFDNLSRLSGQVIAFTPHVTSGATVTLNVDSLGAKPLRSAPSVELPAGVLIEGTPYVALYNNSDQAFYLQSFYGNPYSVPIGGFIDYGGATAPNSSFVLAYGQAISRSTYSTLFAMFSTTYGSGDGSTTFNVPDLRGRVVAGKDDMGGSAASRLSSTSISTGGPTTLGGTGGADTKTLLTANLPPYTPAGTMALSVTSSVSNVQVNSAGAGSINNPGGATPWPILNNSALVSTGTGTLSGTPQGGTSTAFSLAQPTIVLNKLLRII
ncbi:tail fiber protein [Bradyrhizobium yuanmingense]|uniref:tail fiber protein n=1 Tax=Bradyrhizobium yuanmingense TaxID=108015 RepID=UPI001CD5B696|nr:tail fiber protein [Bradyrhizobium yuanmingense]MCA1527356.1 tail fiber protein [Bradyrhizobium yuanmingense]